MVFKDFMIIIIKTQSPSEKHSFLAFNFEIFSKNTLFAMNLNIMASLFKVILNIGGAGKYFFGSIKYLFNIIWIF